MLLKIKDKVRVSDPVYSKYVGSIVYILKKSKLYAVEFKKLPGFGLLTKKVTKI